MGRVSDYLDQANDQVCLLLQVESGKGLANLEAITTVEGVDGIFLGAADLSASLGHIGEPQHPVIVRAMEQAIHCLLECGKSPGLLATDGARGRKISATGRAVCRRRRGRAFACTINASARPTLQTERQISKAALFLLEPENTRSKSVFTQIFTPPRYGPLPDGLWFPDGAFRHERSGGRLRRIFAKAPAL